MLMQRFGSQNSMVLSAWNGAIAQLVCLTGEQVSNRKLKSNKAQRMILAFVKSLPDVLLPSLELQKGDRRCARFRLGLGC
jgi:hypothetical protein